MTIRKILNKKKRIVIFTMICGMIVSGIFIKNYAPHQNGFPPLITFIGFFVAMLALFLSKFIIRCPVCKGNLGEMMMTSGSPFSISKNIHYCPYCGTDVDTEVQK